MRLKRRLNLFDATLFVIGNVVGVGIFITRAYPVVSPLFICVYSSIAIHVAYSKPLTSITGLAITLSRLPFSIWFKTKNSRRENNKR